MKTNVRTHLRKKRHGKTIVRHHRRTVRGKRRMADIKKCACGRDARYIGLMPSNAFAGINEIKQEVPLCEYHKEKAKKIGIEIR